MKDTIINEVEDLYLEHELHLDYEAKCSTCYSELKDNIIEVENRSSEVEQERDDYDRTME